MYLLNNGVFCVHSVEASVTRQHNYEGNLELILIDRLNLDVNGILKKFIYLTN